MPGVTVMALDCFPRQRGMASAAQGFLQMVTMAAISGAVVPLVIDEVPHFAHGQAALFCLAAALWAAVRLLWHLGRRDCGE
jgi:DHA1 family bicyclomycin/chloramphenicol resistance-like MFS transporter